MLEYGGIIGLIIFVLDILAIISVIQSGLEPVMKLVWVLVILVLPLIGLLLWYLIGSKKAV